MDRIRSFIDRSVVGLKEAIVADRSRRKIMFIGLNLALALIAATMSVVNIFTAEYILLVSTAVFSVLCIANVLLLRTRIPERVIYLCFAAEAMTLLGLFFISGIPNGFSVLWVCLIPSFALLIFGRRYGTVFSMLALAMMVFLFWVPAGRSLLQFGYTDTFMLRFPFLYMAIFAISFLEEFMRGETQNRLEDAERRYRYLYRHDALTGLFNRYGFNEVMDAAFEGPGTDRIALLIMDIDDFKLVNDRYGHSAGDEVLRRIAHLPASLMCEHCQYCRWGGEEFAVLMQCGHDPLTMAEKIRRHVEEMAVRYEGTDIHVTVSIGVCVVDDIGHTDIATLVNQADRCLYQSKDEGKNRVTSTVLG